MRLRRTSLALLAAVATASAGLTAGAVTAHAAPAAVPLASTVSAAAQWQAWTAYATGARVTYNGADYEAIQGHTSQPGWEPPNVPALWKRVTGGGDPQPGVPGAPGNLRSTGKTGGSISLAWNASSGTVSGYRVYEGGAQRAQTGGTSATISGLGACTTHTYTVKAYNAQGESAAGARSPSPPTAASTRSRAGRCPARRTSTWAGATRPAPPRS
ncbi:carbohydrate-binding protein [Planomonospora algeriensis]